MKLRSGSRGSPPDDFYGSSVPQRDWIHNGTNQRILLRHEPSEPITEEVAGTDSVGSSCHYTDVFSPSFSMAAMQRTGSKWFQVPGSEGKATPDTPGM